MNQTAIEIFGPGSFSDDESQYFDLVDRVCRREKALHISNSHPRHAVYLIYKLLASAEREVRLFSGKLTRSIGDVGVFENEALAKAACELLSRPDTKLQIAVQDPLHDTETPGDHPFIQRILSCEARQGGLELRRCSAKTVGWLKQEDILMHWMTMDDRAYRLETDVENVKAHADFGDKQMTASLNRLFDQAIFGLGDDMLEAAA